MMFIKMLIDLFKKRIKEEVHMWVKIQRDLNLKRVNIAEEAKEKA